MKKFAAIAIVILTQVLHVSAQNTADSYIDNVVSRFYNASGVTADFVLKGNEQSGLYMQGTLKMKGKKFCLETDDLKTWYDGKTLWSYAVGMCEVNITEPTRQELTEINPYMLLDSYRESFSASELKSEHRGERRFLLLPAKRNTTIKQIVLTIATATLSPVSFEIVGNNDQTTVVAITNYNDKKELSDKAFVFDGSQYKGVTIVDLR